jgi:hypothetical protein
MSQDNNLDALLAGIACCDRDDQLVAADYLEEVGRDAEAALLRAADGRTVRVAVSDGCVVLVPDACDQCGCRGHHEDILGLLSAELLTLPILSVVRFGEQDNRLLCDDCIGAGSVYQMHDEEDG